MRFLRSTLGRKLILPLDELGGDIGRALFFAQRAGAYQHAAALPEWALNVGVQIAWVLILRAIGRAMWSKQLNNMIVQGG